MLPFKMTGASLPPAFGQLTSLPASVSAAAQGGMSMVDHYRTQLLQDYAARMRYMVPSLPGHGQPNPATLAAFYPPGSAAVAAQAGSPWAAYLAYAARQHAADPRLLRLACGDAADAAQRFLRLAGLPHEEPKPSQSYIGLIAMAILSSKEKKLVLSDIYQWILDHYPYFRSRGPGWRNSIRHNLSLNDCFIKCGRSANGKGHYWAVHPANVDDFQRGDFRRRRAQRKVRKAMGMIVPDDDDDDDSPPPLLLHGPPASSAAPPPPPTLWSPHTFTPAEHPARPFSSPLSNCSPRSLVTGVGATPATWLQGDEETGKGGQCHLSPLPRDDDDIIAEDADPDDRCSSPSVDIAPSPLHPPHPYPPTVGDKVSLHSSSSGSISLTDAVPGTGLHLDVGGHTMPLFNSGSDSLLMPIPPTSRHVIAAPSATLKRRLFDVESLLAPDDAPTVKMRMGSFLTAGDMSDLHSKVNVMATPTTTSFAASFSV